MNESDWLARRKEGIGGSEISAILGKNPYKTPYQLWCDKTGRAPPVLENKYMRAGKLMEPVIVEMFRMETGYEILPGTENNQIYTHPTHSFILGTPDRVYRDLEGKRGILECKNTRRSIDVEAFPASWFCQLQYYMGLTGCEEGEIAWLYQGVDFYHLHFQFLPRFYEHMVEKAVDFWERHVQTDIPPPLETAADVEMMFESSDPGKIVEATDCTMECVHQLREVHEELKTLSEAEKKLINQIKMVMRDGESLVKDQEILVTWKTSKNHKRVFLIK